MAAHFDLPLDLPHAATISARIVRRLEQDPDRAALATAHRLVWLLLRYHETGENPAVDEAALVVGRAARPGPAVVDAGERAGVGPRRLRPALRHPLGGRSMGAGGAAVLPRARR